MECEPAKISDVSGRIDDSTALVRRHYALRSVVAAAAVRASWIVDVHRLFDVGRVSGRALLHWQLHFAVLFARDFWRFTACMVSGRAEMVAELD